MGGIERALTVLSEEFYKMGLNVHFISCFNVQHFYTLNQEIKIYEPAFIRSSHKLNKLLFYPRLLYYIRKKVKQINPDWVLVFGDIFSPITLLALLGTKYSVYISEYNSQLSA